MARLSVLLPCRDAAAWLADAARSIERQTYRDYEVLAVDDGSLDATAEILDAWARRDTRVRVLRTDRSGLVAALQLASSHASGEVLARMDADDIAHRRRLELQLQLLDSQPDIAACGTRIRYFPRAALKDGLRGYEGWINSLTDTADLTRDIFVECPIAHPTLLMRRAAFEAVGGYRQIAWPEDYDLVLRLWRAGYGLANVPRVLHAWRERGDRTSRVDARYGHDAFRRCKAFYLKRTLAAERPLLVAGAGPSGKSFAREMVRLGSSLAAFVDVDPRKIRQTIHGVEVVPPERVPEFNGAFGVAAVADRTARAEIRSNFNRAGWCEMVDYCAVA
jgi:glycosyltransferase involved in cell wall biosynthesis